MNAAVSWLSSTFMSAAPVPPPPADFVAPGWIVTVLDTIGAALGSRFYGNIIFALLLGGSLVGLMGVLLYDVYSLGARCFRLGLVAALLGVIALTLAMVVQMSASEFGAEFNEGGQQLSSLWQKAGGMLRVRGPINALNTG
jgi:hypothetical protein